MEKRRRNLRLGKADNNVSTPRPAAGRAANLSLRIPLGSLSVIKQVLGRVRH
jgi:hypothetical protein